MSSSAVLFRWVIEAIPVFQPGKGRFAHGLSKVRAEGSLAEKVRRGVILDECPPHFELLRFGRPHAPVNNRLTLQGSARAFFRFLSGRFRGCPYLLDARKEQVTTMFLVERHRVLVAQTGGLYP
jgi:hypothetical protein